MKKIVYIVTLVCSLWLAGCTPETDHLFEGTSAERIDKVLAESEKVLTSAPNGWLMEYWPSANLTYGGYNVLAAFDEDGNVTVGADIAQPDQIATSLYKLKEQAGAVLTFDTHNEIFHYFSDPASGVGSISVGMGGDYEFLIMSATAEEVILQGKKTGNKIRMTPMPENVTWASYLTAIAESENNSRYGQYKYEINGEEYTAMKSYRTLSFTYAQDGENVTEMFPYIQTENGMKFYEPITLGGGSVSELTYEASTSTWKSENGEAVLKPHVTTSSLFVSEGPWFVTYDGMSAYGKTYAQAGMAEMNSALSSGTLDYFVLGSYLYTNNAVNIVWGDKAGIMELVTTVVSEDQVNLSLSFYGDETGVELFDAGFYYICFPVAYGDGGHTFTVEADDLVNPTKLTLTEVGNEKNVIVVTNQETPFGYHE